MLRLAASNVAAHRRIESDEVGGNLVQNKWQGGKGKGKAEAR